MTLLEQKSDPLLCSNSNMTLLFPPFYAHLCAHAFPYSLELRHILAAATAFVPDLWCLHQAPLTAIGAVRYSAPAVSPDEAPLTFELPNGSPAPVLWHSQGLPPSRAETIKSHRSNLFSRFADQSPATQFRLMAIPPHSPEESRLLFNVTKHVSAGVTLLAHE